MEFEFTLAQEILVKKINAIQDYELAVPIGNEQRSAFVKLGLSLIEAFGSIAHAMERSRDYCVSRRVQHGRQFQLLIAMALVSEGDHLSDLIKAFALERQQSQKDYPYFSIRYAVHEVMELVSYDRDEARDAARNRFYAPRYPQLNDAQGVARFGVDDYLAVFEEAMIIHAYHCLGDLADFPDYQRIMALFESKLPQRHAFMCNDHRDALLMRQIRVNDPRRLAHFPIIPEVDEMDERFLAVISHIMMTGNRDAEVIAGGDDLESRSEGVGRFREALLTLPKDKHGALKDAMTKRIALNLRPSHPGTFQWISEGYFDLEDSLTPIRQLFEAFELAGFGFDDFLLTCMREESDQGFPIKHRGQFDHHERGLCLAYIHQNDLYEENWFRAPLVQIIAERLDMTQVRWDELTVGQASRLYHLAPCPQVIRHTTSPAIRDLIFQGEMGL